MRAAALLLAVFAPVGVLSLVAEETEVAGEVARMGEAYVEAFNKGDAVAVAELWAPDAVYVDIEGGKHAGRDAIRDLFGSFFAGNKGAQLSVDSESLRLVADGVAIEDGTATVVLSEDAPPLASRFANTWSRRDGKWLLAEVRESAVLPSDRSKELGGLAWLAGRWEAQAKGGERILLTADAGPNGNFLVLRRVVLAGGLPVAGGTEWIAWDPAVKAVRSWSFDDDGGFGESQWVPGEDSWSVISTHTLRNGATLAQTQTITLGEDGKVAVKSASLTSNQTAASPAEDLTFSRIQP